MSTIGWAVGAQWCCMSLSFRFILLCHSNHRGGDPSVPHPPKPRKFPFHTTHSNARLPGLPPSLSRTSPRRAKRQALALLLSASRRRNRLGSSPSPTLFHVNLPSSCRSPLLQAGLKGQSRSRGQADSNTSILHTKRYWQHGNAIETRGA